MAEPRNLYTDQPFLGLLSDKVNIEHYKPQRGILSIHTHIFSAMFYAPSILSSDWGFRKSYSTAFLPCHVLKM
jgi:hypothetical protein